MYTKLLAFELSRAATQQSYMLVALAELTVKSALESALLNPRVLLNVSAKLLVAHAA